MTKIFIQYALAVLERLNRSACAAMVVLILVLATSSKSQPPADDSGITDGTYWNTYFDFSYRWPAGMTPVALHLKEPGGPPNDYRKQESLLFAVRKDNKPYGVVILAEPVGIATPKFAPWKDSGDFIHRLQPLWDPQKQWKVLKQTSTTSSAGMVFDELDYSAADENNAILATQIGHHLIVFKCNGPSPEITAAMVRTVLDTKRMRPQ